MLASLTTSLTALALTAASPQAPQWESDYGAALKQTRADERPLLVVIEDPAAQQQIAPAALAADKALGAYDLCRVDASSEYGKKVVTAFDAKSLPYMAIIDKTGTVILHSQSGAVSAEAMKATLAKYQSGERAVRVTVAKPVTVESGVYIESAPVQSSAVQTIYASPSRSYYSPPADCPNCRRGY